MECTVEMAPGGTICILGFMKIVTSAEGILRFCLSNFKGCNAGIISGSNL
jgi:hypothetical protein